MDKKKLSIMFFIIVAIICFIVATVMLITSNNEKSNNGTEITSQTTALTKGVHEMTASIEIANMDGLYFYTSEEHSSIKEQFSAFLLQKGYSNVKVADIVGSPITSDNENYKYWLYISAYEIVIKGEYDIIGNKTVFSIETDKSVLDGLNGIDQPGADGDSSIEEENIQRMPEISNEAILKEHLNDVEINSFKTQLNSYLTEQKEYRRSFSIKEDSISNDNSIISFECIFNAQSLYSQDILVIYHKSNNLFSFKAIERNDTVE